MFFSEYVGSQQCLGIKMDEWCFVSFIFLFDAHFIPCNRYTGMHEKHPDSRSHRNLRTAEHWIAELCFWLRLCLGPLSVDILDYHR